MYQILSKPSSYHAVEFMRHHYGKQRRLSYPLGSAYILSTGDIRRKKSYMFYRLRQPKLYFYPPWGNEGFTMFY